MHYGANKHCIDYADSAWNYIFSCSSAKDTFIPHPRISGRVATSYFPSINFKSSSRYAYIMVLLRLDVLFDSYTSENNLNSYQKINLQHLVEQT